MMNCNKCGGLGVDPLGKYCSCKQGKLQKAIDSSKAKEEEAKAKEAEIRAERAKVKAKRKEAEENVLSELRGRRQERENAVDNVKVPQAKEIPLKREYKAVDFMEGEWVVVNEKKFKGVTFAILQVDPFDDSCLCLAPGIGRNWFGAYKLQPAPLELDEQELKRIFSNMALDTQDKAWFEELGQMRLK